jgi:hypothetical protein
MEQKCGKRKFQEQEKSEGEQTNNSSEFSGYFGIHSV